MADDTGLVWKALADPTRRAILDLLADRARTTGELSGAFPEVSRFAVMKHLGVLETAGLVVVRRRGRERWNHLNGVPLRQAYERWMRPHADRWAESLLRLKETAERQEGAGMTTTLEVEQEVVVAAPREKVFEALCRMGEWWPHTFREGSSVHLEPRVGGRFWEDWGDGDGALYATVTGIRRPEQLTCTGPMGMSRPGGRRVRHVPLRARRRHPGAAVPPRRRPDRRRDPGRLRARLGGGVRRPAGPSRPHRLTVGMLR